MSEIQDAVVEEVAEVVSVPVERAPVPVVVTMSARETGIMPVMDVPDAVQRFRQLKTFAQEVMVEGVDFAPIPGTGDKPVLRKAGAEKLTTFFGLSPSMTVTQRVEIWDGDPLFHYEVKCKLYRGDIFIADADGSCNSREKKYRWRYVQEHQIPEGMDKSTLLQSGGKIVEFAFAVDKAATTGKYGKPIEHWQRFTDAIADGTARNFMKKSQKSAEYEAWEIDGVTYRIPNPDIFDLVNTVLKMAEKRALVAVVLIGVNASEFFTQDMEDRVEDPTTPEMSDEVMAEATAAARMAIGLLAEALGLIEAQDDADGKNQMLVSATAADLYKDNMLTKFTEWIQWIRDQVEGE